MVKPRAIDRPEVANFDQDQKATMINQAAGHDRLFGYLWPRESDNASAAQEICHLLWTAKVHFLVH
jgi:ParB-like chromosome segregation protein Spo0J